MTTPCVEYEGTRNKNGYGILPKPVYGTRIASRAALATKLGRPVVGSTRHTCDNPPCINQDHLIEGTQAQNIADAVERGRIARGPRKTTCTRGHDVRAVGRRSTSGQCAECRREDNQKIAARRKAERQNRRAA